MATSAETPALRFRDVGFGLLCLVSIAAIFFAQYLSLIVFDTTGLDRYVPGAVLYSIVPAVIVTAIPAIVAARQYGRRRAKWITTAVFGAAIVASAFTSSFFVLG